MNSLNFDARYQLLKCVAVADGIRTHNAIELVTGRVVMVHLVDAAGPDEVETLQRRLGRLPQTEKARVLEIATLPAGFAVVTEFLQGMSSFPEWLAARVPDDSIELPSQIPLGASQWPIQRPTEPVAAADPTSTAGESTVNAHDTALIVPPIPPSQEVSTIETRKPTPLGVVPITAAAAPPPLPPAPPPRQASPAASQPTPPAPSPDGEFTQLFGQKSKPVASMPTAQTPVAPPLPVAAPPLPTAPTPPALGEGEFTRMFRGQPPAAPPRKVDPAPSPFVTNPSPAPLPPPAAFTAPAHVIPVPVSPAVFPPAPARPPAPLSSPSADVFFGSLPPVSPPAKASPSPFSAPPARDVSPLGVPLPGATGRPGGLSGPPLGGSPLSVSPLGAPPKPQPPAAPPPGLPLAQSAVPVSPIGAAASGSPMGLPPLAPLPPPPASAPVFPGGASGSASPLGAGRATPVSKGGVYTEMIQRSVTPPPMVAIEKKPTDAPPKKRTIPLGLILVLNAVLILAIALIAYFAFRPKPVPDAPSDATTESLPDSAANATSGELKMPKKPTVPKVTKPTMPAVPKLP